MQGKGKKFSQRVLLAVSVACIVLCLTVPGMAADKKPIIFADFGWDSAQVHNRIAALIIGKGLGYETKFVTGETIMLNTALIQAKGGEAPNVNMESWTENWQKLYDEGLAKGKDPSTDEGVRSPGSQFSQQPPGVVGADLHDQGRCQTRQSRPQPPGLKSVFDLPKYWENFKDPEEPNKGRFYSCIPGWSCKIVNDKKFDVYGLKKNFNIIEPGSDAALAASMVSAYKKGKPWLGYYWAPTWVLGKLDMTMLEEPAFDQKTWDATRGCAYPAVKCDILVHKNMPKWAPDVVEFLKKYETTLDINNKFLAYMRDNKASIDDAATWFLKEYESLWTGWVSPAVAAKVKAAL